MSRGYGSTSSTGGTDGYSIGFQGTADSGPGPSNAFDAIQFSRICDTIASNVFAINKHASTLEKTLKVVGSANDSKAVRESVHVVQVTANSTVNSTAEEFKQLKRLLENAWGLPGGGREEKNRERKLRSDFETAIKQYSNLQNEIVAKMKTTLLRVESYTPSVAETDDAGANLIDQEAEKQAQLQLQQNLEFEQGLLIEREEKIRQIESDILDVNSIMKELGAMVNEQGNVVDTIEGHVEAAYTEVDAGAEELQKASVYQAKSRKRLFCLLGTGLIVLIIVITILIVELKH